MFLDRIVTKYGVKNTLLSMVFCLQCINEEQWCLNKTAKQQSQLKSRINIK